MLAKKNKKKTFSETSPNYIFFTIDQNDLNEWLNNPMVPRKLDYDSMTQTIMDEHCILLLCNKDSLK